MVYCMLIRYIMGLYRDTGQDYVIPVYRAEAS